MKNLKSIHDNMKNVYENNAIEFDQSRNKNLFEKEWLDKFVKYILSGRHILDVGCGSGDPIAKYFISCGFSITGVDYSQGMLELAQKKFPSHKWICCDMRELNLGKFDAIIAWNSFFHLNHKDQRLALKLLSTHLNPDGVFMFTAGPQKGEVIGLVNDKDVYHSSLSYDEYKTQLEKLGLKILEYKLNDPRCNGHSIYLAKKK
jgi:ubiquinone/menaquinone biosynthesis C-methylase UbiE